MQKSHFDIWEFVFKMLRLIIAVVIVYLIYRLVKTSLLPLGKKSEKFPRRPASIEGEDMVKDPYCNTYIPLSDAYKASVNGETLYFCSKECFEKYKKMEKES